MSRLDSVLAFRRIPPKCRFRAGLASDRCIAAEHGGIAAEAQCLQNACSRVGSAGLDFQAAGPRGSAEGVEGKLDGLVGGQRPAFLAGLCEGSVVEVPTDGRQRDLVLRDEMGHHAHAQLLVQSFRA
jgi:hypothetical protein